MTRVLGIVKDGKLIPEELWIKFISGMQNSFDSLETNNERAKRDVANAIVNAVKKRVTCEASSDMSERERTLASHTNLAHHVTPKFGILFSGGVDSSLISFVAKQLKCSFTCYTAGIEGSDDVMWAQQAAKEYNLNLKYKIFSLDEFELILKDTIKILNDADIVKASVGSVLYAAGRIAIADGSNILFGGLGSEEIFAGYQRHEDALGKNDFEALHNECWNGLKNMWKRDLTRDFAIAKKLGLDLRTPFLDKGLIKVAMNVHPMLKIDRQNKKIILREAAEFIGLKKEFAWRKKQAAQYGSNFVSGIEKLAKRNGFKMKKDYLQSLLK